MKRFKSLHLAVVGHVEWVSFVEVEKMPYQGNISHGNQLEEKPAGGGAVSALKMGQLSHHQVHFFTSLGKDNIGKECFKQLTSMGLKLHVAWRDKPTRRGFSFVDKNGDRAITVIGERLQPIAKDPLPWDLLNGFDGVFITATDSEAIRKCRNAKVLCATPRLGISQLNKSNVELDALIGSKLDPDEQFDWQSLSTKPKIIVETEGSKGGEAYPGGRYQAIELKRKPKDTYGCGDSFAAGFTAGLAAKWSIQKSLQLGADLGAECATKFGPYNM